MVHRRAVAVLLRRAGVRGPRQPAAGGGAMSQTMPTLRSGTVTCVDGFLSPEESSALRDDPRHSYWWGSPVMRIDRQKRLVSGFSVGRTSSTTDETWLGPESVQLL